MKAVFLHGVADTNQVWDKVRSHLPHTETEALALPGFGTGIPHDFHATKESYVEWIIDQLEQQETSIHLVGHDWGGMFALRVASLRPDLLRTVASGNGPISKSYEWHQLAKIWQTPKEGEKFMSELDTEKLATLLQELGVDALDARKTAERVDEKMKACILELYRSAIVVGEEWEPRLEGIMSPALIFWGNKDTECPVVFAHEMANLIPHSRVVELNCGHWVPLQEPENLAAILEDFWTKSVEEC